MLSQFSSTAPINTFYAQHFLASMETVAYYSSLSNSMKVNRPITNKPSCVYNWKHVFKTIYNNSGIHCTSIICKTAI